MSRRHSDSDHFVTLHQQDNNAENAALAELLLHRRSSGTPTSKATVKRAASDPGQTLQLSFQEGSYLAYDTTSAGADDAGYFSPSLQDDMFQQVTVNDTMLLQGVDTAHLADTIQFQAASLLQDQATAQQLQDIASFEDYQAAVQNHAHFHLQNQHSVHSADLQAVLNSPLPVSLADFGAYSQQAIVTSCSPLPKDLSYHSGTGSMSAAQSPLHHTHSGSGSGTGASSGGCGSTSYANSPLAAVGAGVHSPLPSPLTQHDSPSFTYPTPPASQEGQSPSFGHSHGSLVTSSLPLSSPHQQQTSDFVQSVIAHGGHVPRVSSPLSAAFYTSTMSSSAAVEAALSEVLPGESVQQGACLGSGTSIRTSSLGLYQSLVNPSPPPQSPLSATTPVPSPLSLSSVPASSSSVSSPLPPSAYTPTQNTQMSFPLSPHHTLQSQMMPNSEDPLLSSSPKDFGSRKRFEFVGGGFHHSAKLVSNGTSDFTSGNLSNGQVTGIVVDSNGELRFVQTSSGQYLSQAKCGTMSGSGSVVNTNMTVMGNGGTTAVYRKTELEVNKVRLPAKCVSGSNLSHQNHYQSRSNTQRSRLHVALDAVKEEIDDDVFLSPTSVPASPVRALRKRLRPETLVQNSPPIHMPLSTYQSRLRAPRMSQCGSSPSSTPSSLPYTPAPMLSPTRPGQGLYWQIAAASAWPSSTTLNSVKSNSGGDSQSSEESQQGLPSSNNDNAPESDVTPHINIGQQFQCTIPPWNPDREKASCDPSHEHLLWDPGISAVCADAEVEMYLEFACCAAVPGGGRNKEYALHLLHMCNGNIHEAMLKLMQPTPALPSGHPLLAYDYNESDRWSAEELDMFHQGLIKYDKDFRSIANEIGSKTIKQCIQFYYLWKKVCPEEYKRMRLARRRQNSDYNGRVDMEFEDIRAEDSRNSIPSFNSRAALNGHIRIHGGGVCGRSPTPDKRPSASTPPALADILEEFPCKICGKVFNKVKSRSAHMKSHRPPDAEPKKPKLDTNKMEAAEHLLVRSLGVTTTIGLGRHT